MENVGQRVNCLACVVSKELVRGQIINLAAVDLGEPKSTA